MDGPGAARYRWEDMPTHFHFGPIEVGPDASIRAAALAVLRRHFAMMLAREPGTRLGDDPEEVHDMRVASRRLRAAVPLFEGVLPVTVVKLSGELVWLNRSLGTVRDLDVQLGQLAGLLTEVAESERVALLPLRSLLEDQRGIARVEMLEALDSGRYEVFVSRFGRTLSARHERRSGRAARPARSVAPDLIENSFRRFLKAGDRIGPGSAPAEYHRLRARGKRARYTLEFFGDLYPRQTEPLVKALTSLQDILGLHQDADVAIERLRLLAVRQEALGPETVFAMGEIAERYRRSMVELRAAFPKAYRQVSGRRWKAFRKSIEAQRPGPVARRSSAMATEGPAAPKVLRAFGGLTDRSKAPDALRVSSRSGIPSPTGAAHSSGSGEANPNQRPPADVVDA